MEDISVRNTRNKCFSPMGLLTRDYVRSSRSVYAVAQESISRRVEIVVDNLCYDGVDDVVDQDSTSILIRMRLALLSLGG